MVIIYIDNGGNMLDGEYIMCIPDVNRLDEIGGKALLDGKVIINDLSKAGWFAVPEQDVVVVRGDEGVKVRDLGLLYYEGQDYQKVLNQNSLMELQDRVELLESRVGELENSVLVVGKSSVVGDVDVIVMVICICLGIFMIIKHKVRELFEG